MQKTLIYYTLNKSHFNSFILLVFPRVVNFRYVANFRFYWVNTSYPMDNCFTSRRNQSRQMPEKDVLYILPAGPVMECAFAR